MKILFVGVLDVEWSTNLSMKRALEGLGHEVVDFNYRTIEKQFNSAKNTFADKWLDKLASFLRSDKTLVHSDWYYRRRGRREMNELLLETVREGQFDLVLLCKTDTVNYNLLPHINRYAKTWYFFMDPMDQVHCINAADYANRSTFASATFSDVTEYFKQTGANVYWITQGVDMNCFKHKTVSKVYDVVFAGTKDTKRSSYVDFLRSTGINVTCFGQGWENKPVFQEQLVDIYCKSKIVLNFCRGGDGFSIRVFQVMGTGSLLLTEYCCDLEKFFQQSRHLDWFKDEKELLDKIKYYLDHLGECEQIASEGRRLVHEEYSWATIMQKIIGIAESLSTETVF